MDYKVIFEFSDIINYITQNYLCYVDLLALTLAYPPVKQYIHSCHYDVKKLILSRLQKIFGEHTQEFNDNLIKYRQYISGSFVLQCIYNTSWENSDIDVYYIEPNNIHFHQYQQDIFIWNAENNINKYNLTYSGNYKSYEYLPVSSRHFVCNNVKLDYIVIFPNHTCDNEYVSPLRNMPKHNYKSIFHFVDDIYDINICKIIYDGQRIYVKNLNNLFAKQTSVNLHLNKYYRTGFWPEESIPEYKLIVKVLKRVKKYKSRGFNINLTFEPVTEIVNAIHRYKIDCELQTNQSKFSRYYVDKNNVLNKLHKFDPNLCNRVKPYLNFL